MLAYLRLLRLPNVFTALADILLGWLVARQTWWWNTGSDNEAAQLAGLLAASAAIYLSGMVLNDVFDLEIDRRERPERPLPSGQIAPATAGQLGWSLWVCGVALGWLVSWLSGQWLCGCTATALGLAVLAYNGGLKATPFGPLAMGSCRFVNVLLGMSTTGDWTGWQLALAGGVGIYICGVTIFAAGEAGTSARGRLILGVAIFLAGMFVLYAAPLWFADYPAVQMIKQDTPTWMKLWLALGALIALRAIFAIANPSPALVQQAVGQCLQSLIILDAVACYSVRDLQGALVILPLLIPYLLLRRVVYAT